jgi:segregation and condensation protein B
MNLDKKIEALLFFKGEPVKVNDLVRLLRADRNAISSALKQLESALSDRGVRLMSKDDEVMLGTAPEASKLIEDIRREELNKDLGKAGIETLSIVLYRGPVTRAEIDYIRGVNSTFILRNLLVRGLIERVSNPKDQRGFLYKPSFELFSFLGIGKIDELPEFDTVKSDLKNFADGREADND